MPFSALFLGAMIEHALEGMFSDPVYGGQKDAAGWKLVNYAGVQMPVSAEQQKFGYVHHPNPQSTYANGAFPEAKKEALA